MHAITEDDAIWSVDDEMKNQLQTSRAKRVGFIVGDAENGEDDRSRNEGGEFLNGERRERKRYGDEVSNKRESDFSLVVKLIGPLE